MQTDGTVVDVVDVVDVEVLVVVDDDVLVVEVADVDVVGPNVVVGMIVLVQGGRSLDEVAGRLAASTRTLIRRHRGRGRLSSGLRGRVELREVLPPLVRMLPGRAAKAVPRTAPKADPSRTHLKLAAR